MMKRCEGDGNKRKGFSETGWEIAPIIFNYFNLRSCLSQLRSHVTWDQCITLGLIDFPGNNSSQSFKTLPEHFVYAGVAPIPNSARIVMCMDHRASFGSVVSTILRTSSPALRCA